MEVVFGFIIKHRVFLIVFLVVIVSYYIIFFAVYGKKRRKDKKPPIPKNIRDFDKKDKNISILAPELDDVPVIEDQISTSGEAPSNNKDWKKLLEDINDQTDRLTHDESLEEYLRDSGIDTED